MKLYAHSTLLYWWPVWLTSLGLGIWSMIAGDDVSLGEGTVRMLASSSPGVSLHRFAGSGRCRYNHQDEGHAIG